MATIDCTLNALTIPGLSGIDPPFGTKRPNGQAITSREANDNITLPYRLQRPHTITENSATTQIQVHSTFEIVNGGVTLTLLAASFSGCRVSVINAANVNATIIFGQNSVVIAAKTVVHLEYVSGSWVVTDDYSDAMAFIAASLDLAGLANREIKKTNTQRIQTGEVLLKNRGIINGCTITKSTTAIRNINLTAGAIFMNGMEIPISELNNAALIQANNTAQIQYCYAYLYQTNAGAMAFACTPLGGTVPEYGIDLYRITVPAGNNEVNAPYLENVTLSNIRRVEAGYPIQFNSIAYASVALPFTMIDADYQVFLDILEYKGNGGQRAFVYPGDKAANGFKIFSDNTLDMVKVKWVAIKTKL